MDKEKKVTGNRANVALRDYHGLPVKDAPKGTLVPLVIRVPEEIHNRLKETSKRLHYSMQEICLKAIEQKIIGLKGKKSLL